MADDGAPGSPRAPLTGSSPPPASAAPGHPDHYAVLGVAPGAPVAEIKAAYRALVKRHHPDAGGGDQTRILALNAAWEVLGDSERRRRYDAGRRRRGGAATSAVATGTDSGRPQATPRQRTSETGGSLELQEWLRRVYGPLDRLLGQVINPFPATLRALSADPYDDDLMAAFVRYLEQSRERMTRGETLYRSMACPETARGFALSLYHCLGQVQDALAELERYSLGYVDDYLHDGREMLREARQRRRRLQEERRRLPI